MSLHQSGQAKCCEDATGDAPPQHQAGPAPDPVRDQCAIQGRPLAQAQGRVEGPLRLVCGQQLRVRAAGSALPPQRVWLHAVRSQHQLQEPPGHVLLQPRGGERAPQELCDGAAAAVQHDVARGVSCAELWRLLAVPHCPA